MLMTPSSKFLHLWYLWVLSYPSFSFIVLAPCFSSIVVTFFLSSKFQSFPGFVLHLQLCSLCTYLGNLI